MNDNFSAEDILEALKTYYHESIFITDGTGKVIFINDEAAKRIGANSAKDVLYRNVSDLLKDGFYERSTVQEAIETKKEAIANLKYKTKETSVSRSIPIFNEKGEVEMVVTNNMSPEHNKEWEEIIAKERGIIARMKRELDHLRLNNKTTFIANSPAMQSVVQTINAIAPTDSNVVLLGESGTGKDIAARLIHEQSNRSEHAFISINCAAIPEQLLESELFGYEGGAFTGALAKGKMGLFEAASGGTIFLDEIGDMPLPLQSKLLRALENREIRRVGGVKNIPVDVRIICATNVNLQTMVEEKKFREDLYYRLSVFLINLPPLCERKEDIIPLAESFLKDLNEKYGTNKSLAPISIQTMMMHNWPGNIREMRNVMERIFVVSPGNELIFTPTPTADYSRELLARENLAEATCYNSLKEFTETAERWYIEQILKECNGCVGDTAKRLGIHRSALYRKMHKDI